MRGYFNNPYNDDPGFTFPPATVVNLSGLVINGNEIDLNWNDASGANGYNVERNGVNISSPTLSFLNDTTVSPGTTYTYRVAAKNFNGSGPFSNTVTLTTAPGQVTGLNATASSSSQINLVWNSVVGATSYTITRNGVTVYTGISGTSKSDTGLSSNTTYTYTVSAVGIGGTGSPSVPDSATTLASGSTSIIWKPGHIARTGSGNSNGLGGSLATVLSFMDNAVAADINNKFVGFCVPAVWANLEGPTAGIYDGSWGTNVGFPAVQQLIDRVKSYNPPRYLMLSLNQAGNGGGANTNTAFPSGFCPSYLNNSIYDGGAEWAGRTGYSGYPNVNTTFWNANTAQRVVNMIKAYYNHFGPESSTGGIYMWELTNEISMNAASHFTGTEFLATVQSTYSQLRTQCPEVMFSIRPTFINPPNASNYNPLIQAMFDAKIAVGNEDGTNITAPPSLPTAKFEDWGSQAYRGAGIVAGSGAPNHAALGDFAFIFNVENAEYGHTGSGQQLIAVPPASKGSGYIYDDATWPGIMDGANIVNASHIIWFLDGQFGPNVNRFKFPNTPGQAPANPTPGPGAGLNTVRPHLVDVITGNTSQPGITGPIAIPSSARPTGW